MNVYSARANTLCMNVYIWDRDLDKVRHTRVRDIIPHVQASHMRLQRGNLYFLVFPWQGYASGLDVECPTLVRCMKGEYSITQFTKEYETKNA